MKNVWLVKIMSSAICRIPVSWYWAPAEKVETLKQYDGLMVIVVMMAAVVVAVAAAAAAVFM